MWLARRWLSQQSRIHAGNHRTLSVIKNKADHYGIPIQPTWSVNELLSSYPTPSISSSTLARLHELSALILPTEGTLEHEKLKREMEELVRLVEAVKLVDTGDVQLTGRYEEHRQGESHQDLLQDQEISREALLHHGTRTSNGFYVVDSDRKR